MAMNGYQKASIFLSSVGENAAAQILKHLDSDVIGKVSSYMAKGSKSERNEIEAVFNEASKIISSGAVQFGGEEYVKKILNQGLGNEDEAKILEMV